MFSSRLEAGRLLAQKLVLEKINKAILLAIPRGGVVVGSSINQELSWPLLVVITKKLSAPQNEELAIGAVGEDGSSVFLNEELIDQLNIDQGYLNQEIDLRVAQVKRRKKFFSSWPWPSLVNKKVVIVDDGVATGATIIAAIRQVKKENPDEVIVAVPVISSAALEKIKKEADRVIYLKAPKLFFSVSQFYENFDQVSNEEVKRILAVRE
ncbi:MAG: phosphoribosyltransferase [Patescibacteria group bacterium]|jgi:putative phosphoribosyl transferase